LDEPPEGLKTVLVGGGPVDAAILIQAVEAGFPIRTTYGMTEFASQIATSEIWARKGATLNCGRPLDGFEIRISPEGELLAKGPALFSGYWVDGILKSPELIDGWLATGDLGSISDGALTVRGRKDEVFISGGENVQPSEIESALLALDEIVEAVVVPIPDAEFDWRPAAVIKWRTDRPDEDWIRSRLAERLPGYMIPVVLLDWPSAAEGAGIKPDRPALKAAVPTYWREWGRFLQESGDISAVD
jgi:O-succinylbenzoic acid--CoA ligase